MRFTYQGREYDGFDHRYNDTINNERAVEVAVARRWMRRQPHGAGLEVGNVMAHYGAPRRRVVDLYEEGPNVENIDVFDITGLYDWIMSISTLEHIDRAVDALEHLLSCRAAFGRLLITAGAGQHGELDAHLATGAGATRWCTMARMGSTWVQTPEPVFLPYSQETKAASVWIGEW